MIFLSFNWETIKGFWLKDLFLLPICPNSLSPQTVSTPRSIRAIQWSDPQPIFLTLTSLKPPWSRGY